LLFSPVTASVSISPPALFSTPVSAPAFSSDPYPDVSSTLVSPPVSVPSTLTKN